MRRTLVFARMLRNEKKVADLHEGAPLWKVLTMTLFEISLPRHPDEAHQETNLKTIFSAMGNSFYSGMKRWLMVTGILFRFEIAVSDKRDDIIFYVAVPNMFVNLFEKASTLTFSSCGAS